MNIVHIHRWVNPNTKITYRFGHQSENPDIPIVIFQDDSLEKAITKIALGIYNYHKERDEKDMIPSIDAVPYIWTNKLSLRFEKKGLPVNPWNAKDIILTDSTIHYADESLFMKKIVNIVFINNIPSKIKDFYFPDRSVTWKPKYKFKEFINESKSLYELWNIPQNEAEEQRKFIFSKVQFHGKIKLKDPLRSIFENTRTSSQFPFIQYIEDTAKILYKIWKKHEISVQNLQSWTFYDKLPKMEMIIAMIPLERENAYARASIDIQGELSIQYQIDSRDKIEWTVIEKYTDKIKKWFEQVLHTPLQLQVNSITGKGEFAAQGISIQDVTKVIGKESIFIPLYHIIRLHESVLYAVFKRSQNYRSQIDITDYISSNIKLGIPLEDITKSLIELGISQKEVIAWIEQYQSQTETQEDMPKKKSTVFTGCLFKIEKSPYGFRVSMENVATLQELEYIYHWVRSTFKYIMQKIIVKKAPVAAVPTVASVVPIAPAVAPIPAPSSPPKTEPPDNDNDFGEEIEFDGGAVKKGKGTDRYFLTQLQENDPAIFLDTKNYARLCAANNFRQPVVVSQKEKENIDKNGFKNSYDDSVLYGSDTGHLNHYMCPRIWCPTSRVPLTEKQLEDNDGKCPGPHFEKPLILYNDKYWDNNPKIAHHIGFHKQKTPTGLCLPCCMKNPLKEREIADCKAPESGTQMSKKQTEQPAASATANEDGTATATAKEEGYIMGAVAPLPLDRYGAIPKDMHTFLQPNVPYQLCSKNITSTECYLRRGIYHDDDSFMNAVAIGIGMKNKKEFVKFILKHLDPLTFITMGNGHILQAFMKQEPLIPKDNHKLIKEWNEWIKGFSKYARFIGNSGDLSQNMLSRELAIYSAYKNFIKYLESNDLKNPEHIRAFLLTQNMILLIWKRNGDEATLQCSTYSDVREIFTLAQNKKIAMVLEEKGYYEPIELKHRGKQGVSLFEENGKLSKAVSKVMHQCPVPYKMTADTYSREHVFIENIRHLVSWIDARLLSGSAFRIQTVILRQDLQIYGFITRAGLIIRGPQEGVFIHILPQLFKNIYSLEKLVYLEDIAGKKIKISEVFATDFRMFQEKIEDIGCILYYGTLLDSSANANAKVLSGKLEIERMNMSILPVIRTRTNDDLRKNEVEVRAIDKKWFEIQNYIGKTLLKSYETLVEPLLKVTRKERIRILMNTFRMLPEYEKDKIQMTLEEIPLEYGKDALAGWIRNIGLEKRAQVYTSAFVQSATKEWVFSQAAVENGLPIEVLKPVKSVHAYEKFAENKVVDYSPSEQNEPSTAFSSQLPGMLNKTACTLENLPSKWIKTKMGAVWDTYKWYSFSDYSRDSIPELFTWIHRVMHIPFSWKDIQNIRGRTISGLLQNKETAIKILDDPSLVKAWAATFNKKYKDSESIWNNKLNGLGNKERIVAWMEVIEKQGATIWPTDLDFKIIAELMNISILVIYRGKYGEGAAQAAKRGGLEDLYLSSTFYRGTNAGAGAGADWHMRPCIMFYRTIDKDKIVFSTLVHSPDDTFIHMTVNTMPKDIQDLFEYHVKKHKKRHEESSSNSTSSK